MHQLILFNIYKKILTCDYYKINLKSNYLKYFLNCVSGFIIGLNNDF